MDKQSEIGPEDIEANEFACCLLMPEEAITGWAESYVGRDPLIDCANHFRVPLEAAAHRLHSLGYSLRDILSDAS